MGPVIGGGEFGDVGELGDLGLKGRPGIKGASGGEGNCLIYNLNLQNHCK